MSLCKVTLAKHLAQEIYERATDSCDVLTDEQALQAVHFVFNELMPNNLVGEEATEKFVQLLRTDIESKAEEDGWY